MRVLIVGLGYAGTRFCRAFESLWTEKPAMRGQLAYVNRTQIDTDIPYYPSVFEALARYRPDVVVLSVNDVHRAEVSKDLTDFDGFVICEKPFICPWDDLDRTAAYFSKVSGFCLDLIERYSEISETLRQYVEANELELLRANFIWGKDRIGDHRPTCGVTSEIIHALDLIPYVSGNDVPYQINAVHGVRSDFSISGSDVVDSVSILGTLGDAVISGYASFVNASRRREIGYIFSRRAGGLVFANMTFDEPNWDDDHLRIWEMTASGENTLIDKRVVSARSASGDMGIAKLIRLASDASDFLNGDKPKQTFPDIKTAIRLQNLLNSIHGQAVTSGPVMSFSRYGSIPIMSGRQDWEALG